MRPRDRLTVEDLMTTAVISVRARDPITVADDNMRLAEVRHLPVVDERRHVVGIVSNRDLLRVSMNPRRATLHVADVMTHPALTVRPQTPAADAASLLLTHRIGSLPVVADDGELIGVITATDFLEVAHRALAGRSVGQHVEN